MSDEAKVTSMRLNINDLEKFKKFAAENKWNQEETFNSLISLAEIEKAKNTLGNRSKEIESFRDTVTKLLNFYINSLEINQTTEERIREELSKELKRKDDVIATLTLNVEEAKAKTEQAKEKLKEEAKAFSGLSSIKSTLDENLRKANKDLSDKDNQIEMLNRNNNTLQDQLTEYKLYKDNNKLLETELAKLQEDISTLQQNNNKLSIDNELLNNKVDSDADMINFYKAEIGIKENTIKEYKADIKALEGKHIEELANVKEEQNKALEKQLVVLEEQYNNKLITEVSRKDLEIEKLANTINLRDLEIEKLADTINTKNKKLQTKQT